MKFGANSWIQTPKSWKGKPLKSIHHEAPPPPKKKKKKKKKNLDNLIYEEK